MSPGTVNRRRSIVLLDLRNPEESAERLAAAVMGRARALLFLEQVRDALNPEEP